MTRKMFYDLLLAAVLLGMAVAVVSTLTGCGTFKATPALKTRKELVNKQGKPCNECDEPCHEVQIDPRDEKIKDLEQQLRAAETRYSEGYWAGVKQTEEGYRGRPMDKDLEVTHLIVGEDAQKVWDESTRGFMAWCRATSERDVNCNDLPKEPKVKTIVIKGETDVICLEFPMGPNEPNVKRCYNAESASGA